LTEQILADGKAIVLFDGLDEVNLEGGARLRLTGTVRDFARQYGNNRVLITCRTAATEYVFEGFNYCELAEFTQEQIEAFVARWFQQDQAKREAFWKAFMQPEHERLRDLGWRPLLLTMLCLTFEETMAFPRRRAELYEEAIDALLKKWDSSRSIQRDMVYRKLSLGYKRQLLMEIAAETFERGEQFMRKRDLAARVSTFLRRLPPADGGEDVEGEAVLRSIEAQHGLLIERAHDIYSFSHLTFHEYFAARYIADHPERAVLRGVVSHAADPRWREVLLLTASMLDYRNVARLFECWCEQLEQDVLANAELEVFVRWADSQSAPPGARRAFRCVLRR
jgi:predicted NACHT family NTPase